MSAKIATYYGSPWSQVDYGGDGLSNLALASPDHQLPGWVGVRRNLPMRFFGAFQVFSWLQETLPESFTFQSKHPGFLGNVPWINWEWYRIPASLIDHSLVLLCWTMEVGVKVFQFEARGLSLYLHARPTGAFEPDNEAKRFSISGSYYCDEWILYSDISEIEYKGMIKGYIIIYNAITQYPWRLSCHGPKISWDWSIGGDSACAVFIVGDDRLSLYSSRSDLKFYEIQYDIYDIYDIYEIYEIQ